MEKQELLDEIEVLESRRMFKLAESDFEEFRNELEEWLDEEIQTEGVLTATLVDVYMTDFMYWKNDYSVEELQEFLSTYKEKWTKICLYCENKTSNDPHFESGCCGRGMCDDCYNSDVGTMEQMQVDTIGDEDYEKYIKGTHLEGCAYVCFECLNKTKVK